MYPWHIAFYFAIVLYLTSFPYSLYYVLGISTYYIIEKCCGESNIVRSICSMLVFIYGWKDVDFISTETQGRTRPETLWKGQARVHQLLRNEAQILK